MDWVKTRTNYPMRWQASNIELNESVVIEKESDATRYHILFGGNETPDLGTMDTLDEAKYVAEKFVYALKQGVHLGKPATATGAIYWRRSTTSAPESWDGEGTATSNKWTVTGHFEHIGQTDERPDFALHYQVYMNGKRVESAPFGELREAMAWCQNVENTTIARRQQEEISQPDRAPGTSCRARITPDMFGDVIGDVQCHILDIVEKHGDGSFITTHEMRGVIDEEVDELMDAFKAYRKSGGQAGDLEHNLLDVAAVCAFMLACVRQGGLDW